MSQKFSKIVQHATKTKYKFGSSRFFLRKTVCSTTLWVYYSQTRSSVLPKNQDLVLLFKIWIRSSFELLKLKSKNGLLESSLDLNNQIWLEYRIIVVVSWTLEDVTKCVWPCLRTWKASLDLYSSARIDYISFQRRFFRKRKLQKSCGDESFCW